MDWKQHERDVAALLGLDSTPNSGATFHAPGDAVDNHHRSRSRFAVLADCKFTEKMSFTLQRAFLADQVERATSLGKRFAMPIRFWHHGATRPDDYILITLDDFAELLHLSKIPA